MNDECVPARMVRARGGKQIGDYCSKVQGSRQARDELTKREGPPQGDKNYCCHNCPNDSSAPAGFVCTLHTRWGTNYENAMDQAPETRKRNAVAGGRVGGNSPNNPNKLQVTCPHCGKTGAKMAMSRWHFDNCPHKLPQLLSPTQSAAHVVEGFSLALPRCHAAPVPNSCTV